MKNKRPISEMADDDFGTSQVKRRSGFPKVIATIVLIVVVVLAVGYIGSKFFSGGSIASISSDWQAIFLVNGQVYFGQVKDVSSKTLSLKNIYYLQVVSKPIQGTQAAANPEQELTLVKLGNEIHGPQDAMIINRDQILLTERLKNDSKVVIAINDYLAKEKTGQNKQTQNQNPAQTTIK